MNTWTRNLPGTDTESEQTVTPVQQIYPYLTVYTKTVALCYL